MENKNSFKSFLKWYLKYFFISIIIGLILTGGIYFYINYESEEDKYYNNYYEINKKDLNVLKDYINKNNLKGSFTSNSIYYNEGNLYNKCIKNRKCYIKNINFINFIRNLNITGIKAYRKYKGILPGDIDVDFIGISIYLNEGIYLYGRKDNYIYYSKGYYKGKKPGNSIDGNKMHVILKIFNNDWGIVSGCYGC